eukprot:TRINITY_DN10236_c0_g1_i1.p4 TRINITY_DN10236_c0_g1~~TRINITY_DN10236_c0_g1_i1.p4  ORF type:complete len:159 (-),score=16.02 TRINITY_DN10236_c0_g1_i1:422-898(-)
MLRESHPTWSTLAVSNLGYIGAQWPAGAWVHVCLVYNGDATSWNNYATVYFNRAMQSTTPTHAAITRLNRNTFSNSRFPFLSVASCDPQLRVWLTGAGTVDGDIIDASPSKLPVSWNSNFCGLGQSHRVHCCNNSVVRLSRPGIRCDRHRIELVEAWH